MPGKKFKFGLDKVLKLRHYQTEEARHALVAAVTERERQEALLEEAQRKLHEVLTSSPMGVAVDPRSLKQHDSYRRDAQRACIEARRVLNAKEKQEQEARSQLVDRRREEEALLHLHDQQKLEHTRIMEAADLAFIDESAITGFLRKG